jgi:predicted O-linked N-acetylglucosamine transferase (SPINDLY family)
MSGGYVSAKFAKKLKKEKRKKKKEKKNTSIRIGYLSSLFLDIFKKE